MRDTQTVKVPGATLSYEVRGRGPLLLLQAMQRTVWRCLMLLQ